MRIKLKMKMASMAYSLFSHLLLIIIIIAGAVVVVAVVYVCVIALGGLRAIEKII